MRNTHRERGFRFCICFYDLSASVLAAGEGSLEGSLRVLQTLASAAVGIEGAVRFKNLPKRMSCAGLDYT